MSGERANETVSPENNLAISVSEDAIAKRAYAFFEARGSQHGHDIDDWLQAERELQDTFNHVIEDPLDAEARS